MKKSQEVEPKERQNKKEANTNAYLCALSDRLQKLRTEKKLSQQELAKKAGTIREKIMYAELNLQGRVLKADELAEIAKVLEVSTDYLLGISNSLTSNNSNGLSDISNNLVAKMGDNQIGLLDKMIPELENQKQLEFLQIHIAVSYVNKNILPHILNDIRLKTENNKDLTSVDIQKVSFMIWYLGNFKNQKVEYSDYIQYLGERYDKLFRNAWGAIGQLTYYNEDKNIKIDYETIGSVKKILNEFESYAECEVIKRLNKSIQDLTYDYVKDDAYFNEIKQAFNEIIKPENEEETK